MSAAPATIEPQRTSLASLRDPAANSPLVVAGFNDSHGFALLQRMANALASSSLVPQAYQGNTANCMIALELAHRIGASPLMVAQNLYIVHGKPAWSSQFLIAAVNQCGRYTSLQYEWSGEEGRDSWTCRAFATEKATSRRVQGPAVSVKMAKDQGWWGRKDSKWPSMTELMMTYRAATYFARTNAPELTMGLQTADEAGDTFDTERGPGGEFTVTTESLRREEPAAPRKPRQAKTEPEPVAAEAAEKTAEPAGGSEAPEPFTDEAKALLAIDKAKDEGEASAVVDRCKGQPFYGRVVDGFNARFSSTLGD